MKRVIENLENKNEHYLYPFFWQKGQSNEKLKEYIDQMREQGIYNICIESRPHPEFLEEGWWNTMDFLIQEAKKNDMKIWILDDAKFPTGYANGKVPNHLKKTYLDYYRFDLVGPNPYAEMNLSLFCDMREAMKDKRHQHDQFFKAILVEKDMLLQEGLKEDTAIDVSEGFKDHILHLNLENKHYSLFVFYTTICGEEATQDYLDPMNKEATQILINEVYEKHFNHYKDEFGKTIIGFFSDEPRFGNIKGTTASIGREKMPLPWNDEVYQKLQNIKGYQDTDLIFLFTSKSTKASQIRFNYMNIVSQLYSQNFSQYIGDWCSQRHVDYVGHTIEDNGAHARLGYGAGHFFRAMAGQSMAGIDIIGGQVIPGMDYQHDAFSTGGSNGEFYHYALVKLGASLAKLDPSKQGKLMCEAFGAYGWVEGLKMMKWITDHMLSHGVNVIVPHAFDPADFPDWDCPPHFYAHGNNPQYPYFHKWSLYADRLCHLFSGGYHKASVGVLYHAFAEWSGDYMPIEKVLKELQQRQISCDIISEDYLNDTTISNHQYCINGYHYDVLVIPYAQRLPQLLIEKLKELSQSIKVIFINDYPENMSSGEMISLSCLSEELKDYSVVKTSSFEKDLVVYSYQQADGIIYMFYNENITDSIHSTVTLHDANYMIYDAYQNKSYSLNGNKVDGGFEFTLTLHPYQSLVLVNGQCYDKIYTKSSNQLENIDKVKVSFREYNQKDYSQPIDMSLNHYLGYDYPRFSGNIKYAFDIDCQDKDIVLVLKEAYEIVELIVNGESVETLITPPYEYDLSTCLNLGTNHIELITTNNLSRNQRDSFSRHLALEPLGIIGSIELYKKEED